MMKINLISANAKDKYMISRTDIIMHFYFQLLISDWKIVPITQLK